MDDHEGDGLGVRDSGDEDFYTEQERELVRAGSLPFNTYVWSARHAGREAFLAMANNASSLPGVSPHLEVYVTTMSYKVLVLQAMTVRPSRSTTPTLRWNVNNRR